jgi:hypothetical protein
VDGEGDKALRREWSFFGFWHLSSAWLLKKMHDVEPEHTVEFEIGFIAEHSMILFLTHILKCTNPLWLASFQTPEFAYLPALECCT